MKDLFDEMKEVAVNIIGQNNPFRSPQLRANLESQKEIAREIVAIVDRVKTMQNVGWQSVGLASHLLPDDFSSITAPSNRDEAFDEFRSVGQLNILIGQAEQEVMLKMQEIGNLQEALQSIFASMQTTSLASGIGTFSPPLDNENPQPKIDDVAPSFEK